MEKSTARNELLEMCRTIEPTSFVYLMTMLSQFDLLLLDEALVIFGRRFGPLKECIVNAKSNN